MTTRVVPDLYANLSVLRGPLDADVDGLIRQCNDEATLRWTTVPRPYGPQEAASFLTHMRESRASDSPTAAMFWVIDASTAAGPTYAGTVELRFDGEGAGEIAYAAAPEARGSGLMTDAVRRVCRFGFDDLSLTHIHWQAFEGNQASWRVAEKVGFRREGTIRGWLTSPTGRHDAWVGSLTPDELR